MEVCSGKVFLIHHCLPVDVAKLRPRGFQCLLLVFGSEEAFGKTLGVDTTSGGVVLCSSSCAASSIPVPLSFDVHLGK
ncbi:hypothetical protein F4824DRAFT_495868 [Ustulina deusta]|nr:hypothetical protein F4824DRAFT_495868 [Ustulina deusta]